MNKQLSKIEEFVTSIESTQMADEQLSLVLSYSSNVIGGANGSGQCSNYDVDACGGVNKRCTNYQMFDAHKDSHYLCKIMA